MHDLVARWRQVSGPLWRENSGSLGRGALATAIGALVVAALATFLGFNGVAQTCGALTWGLGLVGAVLGLTSERRNEPTS